MKVKRIEAEGNEWYPLPPDYPELSDEGKRQARVNGIRQWRVKQDTRLGMGQAYVASLRFFDMYYLHADEEVEFDPMFYDDEPLPTPLMHYDIARQWASQRLCIAIAPRGSAKSFLVKKSILLEMLSQPTYSVVYATSSGDNTKYMGQTIRDQFSLNQRVQDDFNPECPDGHLVPKRGEAPFGQTYMVLMNGSWLRCISAESKQRGMRPRLYVLDDPEFDPKASTSMQLIRDYMDTLLFRMVLPMVMRKGCGCRWLATFVSKRHYAWHAMDTITSRSGRKKAVDSRFENWDRIIIRSEYTDSEGKRQSCWPEMWPPHQS
jgi:hypothetical protein